METDERYNSVIIAVAVVVVLITTFVFTSVTCTLRREGYFENQNAYSVAPQLLLHNEYSNPTCVHALGE